MLDHFAGLAPILKIINEINDKGKPFQHCNVTRFENSSEFESMQWCLWLKYSVVSRLENAYSSIFTLYLLMIKWYIVYHNTVWYSSCKMQIYVFTLFPFITFHTNLHNNFTNESINMTQWCSINATHHIFIFCYLATSRCYFIANFIAD